MISLVSAYVAYILILVDMYQSIFKNMRREMLSRPNTYIYSGKIKGCRLTPYVGFLNYNDLIFSEWGRQVIFRMRLIFVALLAFSF